MHACIWRRDANFVTSCRNGVAAEIEKWWHTAGLIQVRFRLSGLGSALLFAIPMTKTLFNIFAYLYTLEEKQTVLWFLQSNVEISRYIFFSLCKFINFKKKEKK